MVCALMRRGIYRVERLVGYRRLRKGGYLSLFLEGIGAGLREAEYKRPCAKIGDQLHHIPLLSRERGLDSLPPPWIPDYSGMTEGRGWIPALGTE